MPTYFARPLTLLEAVRAARLIAVVVVGRAEDIGGRFEGFSGIRCEVKLSRILKDASRLGQRSLPLLVLRGLQTAEDKEAPKDATARTKRSKPARLLEGTEALLFAVRYDGRRDLDDDDKTDYVPYLEALLPIEGGEVNGGNTVDFGGGDDWVALDEALMKIERRVREVDAVDQKLAREAAELRKPVEVSEVEPHKDMRKPAAPEPGKQPPGPQKLEGPARPART